MIYIRSRVGILVGTLVSVVKYTRKKSLEDSHNILFPDSQSTSRHRARILGSNSKLALFDLQYKIVLSRYHKIRPRGETCFQENLSSSKQYN